MNAHLDIDSTTVPAMPAQPSRAYGRASAGWATVARPFEQRGEHRLLLAVLEDGLRVLLQPRGRVGRVPRLDELDWVSSDDRSHPFAFLSICEALDIDADRLRRRVYEACRAAGIVLLLLATLLGAPARADASPRGGRLGAASWYGPGFANRPTASGTRFDPARLTAAHRTLPLGTRVRVTNLHNGRSVDVLINDRGPFVRSRDIDLSLGAAQCLDMVRRGVAKVLIEPL